MIQLSKVLNAFVDENLQQLRTQGLYNEIDSVEGPNGPIITIRGQQLINLSSNNYLGLATNDTLKEVAKKQSTNTVLAQGLCVQLTVHWICM